MNFVEVLKPVQAVNVVLEGPKGPPTDRNPRGVRKEAEVRGFSGSTCCV